MGTRCEQLKNTDKKDLHAVLNGKKASEVFLDYAMPLIENVVGDDKMDLKKIEEVLRVPWMVWNSCIYEQSNIKEKNYLAEMKKLISHEKDFEEIVKFFEYRKKTEFKKYNYLMGTYQLIPQKNGELNLRIESRTI